MGRRLVAVLALLSLGACLTPPPAVVSIPAGEVRASDAELAQEVADYAVQMQAELEQRLPGLREPDFDVWVQHRIRSGLPWWKRPRHASGLAVHTPNSTTCRVHVPTSDYRHILPHELTHALLGEDWDPLPALVEEGLCEIMNVALTGEAELALIRLMCAQGSIEAARSNPDRAARLSLSSLLARPESRDLGSSTLLESQYAYGLAYFLVDRIERRRGLRHLYELCLRAHEESLDVIPSAWIFEAAGLEPTTDLGPLIAVEQDRVFFEHLLQSGELERLLMEIEVQVAAQEGATWSFSTVTVSYDLEDGSFPSIQGTLADLPGFERWRAGVRTSDWPHLKP